MIQILKMLAEQKHMKQFLGYLCPLIKKYFTENLLYAYGFIICIGMLFFAGYLQHVKGLAPCPLCVIQRVILMILTIQFFCGMLFRALPKIIHRLHAFLVIMSASAGIFVAGRQVWLQSLPEGLAPACGPSLDYMLKYLPFSQVMEMVLHGSGECARIEWTLLSWSIAQWSLAFFIFASIIGVINLFRKV